MAKFNPNMLNDLLNSTSSKFDNLQQQLDDDQQYQLEDVEQQDVQVTNNDMLDANGRFIDIQRVYGELESLINTGKETLEILNAIDPDVTNSGTLSAAGTLINSINNLLDQFTKIHLANLKYQQIREHEEIKHQHKLQIIEYRSKLNSNENANSCSTNMVPWNSNLMIEFQDFLDRKEIEEGELV